jgi:hypothetical protein
MSGIFKDGVYYPLLGPGESADNSLGLGEDGEMFEDKIDWVHDRRLNHLSIGSGPFRVKDGYWRTRDGHVIEIAKMTTAHLDNSIKYFERRGLGDISKIRELRKERKKR